MNEKGLQEEQEAVLASAKAMSKEALKIIPLIGQIYGIGQTGIDTYYNEKRWRNIWEEVSRKVTIEEVVEFFNTEEGYYFANDLIEKLMKERNKSKAKAYSQMFSDGINGQRSNNLDQLETMAKILSDLSVSELKLLEGFCKRLGPGNLEINGWHFWSTGGVNVMTISRGSEKDVNVIRLTSFGLIEGTEKERKSGFEVQIIGDEYRPSNLGLALYDYLISI